MIPLQTWVRRNTPSLTELYAVNGSCPFVRDGSSKHTTWTYLPTINKCLVYCGDASPIGSDFGVMHLFDLLADTWEIPPGQGQGGRGPGFVCPCGRDEADHEWDPLRQKVWWAGGASNELNKDGQLTTAVYPAGFPTGSTFRAGVCSYDLGTNVWTAELPAASMPPKGNRKWFYDPVKDVLISGGASQIHVTALSPSMSATNPANRLVSIPNIDWANNTGYVTGSLSGVAPAVDVIGRRAYWLPSYNHFISGVQVANGIALWAMNLDTYAMTLVCHPSNFPPPGTASPVQYGKEQRIVWDSRNRAVLWPEVDDTALGFAAQGYAADGVVLSVHVWDTRQAAPAWQTFPGTYSVDGHIVFCNSPFYHPKENVLIGSGGATFAESQNGPQGGIYLWRYQ